MSSLMLFAVCISLNMHLLQSLLKFIICIIKIASSLHHTVAFSSKASVYRPNRAKQSDKTKQCWPQLCSYSPRTAACSTIKLIRIYLVKQPFVQSNYLFINVNVVVWRTNLFPIICLYYNNWRHNLLIFY